MPRADRISLDKEHFMMPAVDALSNNGSLNVLLDRTLNGLPAGIPADRTLVGLFTNFCRLLDKALREYDAAREEINLFLTPSDSLRTVHYLRAVDHAESCISATHRATLNASELRSGGIGRSGPRPTERQRRILRDMRDAIEHSDNRLTGKKVPAWTSSFGAYEPYSVRLANSSMVIGSVVLTYRDLLSVLTKSYRTVEVIRGVPTGTPSPSFPNARLRTTLPDRQVLPQSPGVAQMHPTEYLQELSRIVVTH